MRKQWQLPMYWQDFEHMCELLFKEELKALQAFRYGRAGQAQHGVDIALKSKGQTHWTGVQCKLKSELLKGTFSEQDLIDAHTESRKFNGGLEILYLATTIARDRVLQDLARAISLSWQTKHPIEIKFWDDIEDMLEKHVNVANQFYPEAFAPENSLNASNDGELNIALYSKGTSERLSLFFQHSVFKAIAGSQHANLMTIVSELVDNLLSESKGKAQRVTIALSGQVLTICDDGQSFNSMKAQRSADEPGEGLRAMQDALRASKGQLKSSYEPKSKKNAYNSTKFQIEVAADIQRMLCSATGPATFLLNRDEASKFVRDLDISNDCTSFTLRLYRGDFYANRSSTSQLIEDLKLKLKGRPLTLKMSQDSLAFLGELRYIAIRHPDVIVEFV
jgi:hypothetical protein